jgi:hypothetical protein
MADGKDRTLAVAIAGITATALVGLAGTGASWMNARDDRAAQRELASEERNYDKRVEAYLDAIRFVEDQRGSYNEWVEQWASLEQRRIPVRRDPPDEMVARLRAFGSAKVLESFQQTQKLQNEIPISYGRSCPASYRDCRYVLLEQKDRELLDPLPNELADKLTMYNEQVVRLERTVNDELAR